MRRRVLITGARAPAALALARCFAAAGWEVHMADSVRCRMAAWSRAVVRVHRYAAPREERVAFAADVVRLVREIEPVLVVPACEEVFYLAAVEALHGVVFAPRMDVLRRLHSKQMFVEDCVAAGLRAPETHRVTSVEQLDAYRAEAGKLVFKPEYSRFGVQALVGPEVEALRGVAPTQAAPWVVQRRVRGVEVSLYAVCVDGRLAAFSAYRSAWRLEGGAGYAFEAVEAQLFERLRGMAETLAAQLVQRGQFACDVMVDEAGEPWLLECNPRATSGVFMFEHVAELAQAMAEEREEAALGQTQARHLALALWLYGLPQALKQQRLPEWTKAQHASHDVIGARADQAPLLGALVDSMSFYAKALAKKKGLAEVMTADIEWNGEEL